MELNRKTNAANDSRYKFVAYWRARYQYSATHAFLDEFGNFCTPADDPIHLGWEAWQAALANQADAAPVEKDSHEMSGEEARILLGDRLSQLLDATELMRNRGIEQNDFPEMFAEFVERFDAALAQRVVSEAVPLDFCTLERYAPDRSGMNMEVCADGIYILLADAQDLAYTTPPAAPMADVSWEDGFRNLLFALKVIAGAPKTCDDPVNAAQMFSTMPWVEALESLGIKETPAAQGDLSTKPVVLSDAEPREPQTLATLRKSPSG